MGYRNYREWVITFDDYPHEKKQNLLQNRIDKLFSEIAVELNLDNSNALDPINDRTNEATIVYDKFKVTTK